MMVSVPHHEPSTVFVNERFICKTCKLLRHFLFMAQISIKTMRFVFVNFATGNKLSYCLSKLRRHLCLCGVFMTIYECCGLLWVTFLAFPSSYSINPASIDDFAFVTLSFRLSFDVNFVFRWYFIVHSSHCFAIDCMSIYSLLQLCCRSESDTDQCTVRKIFVPLNYVMKFQHYRFDHWKCFSWKSNINYRDLFLKHYKSISTYPACWNICVANVSIWIELFMLFQQQTFFSA